MDTNSLLAIVLPIAFAVLISLGGYLFEKDRERKARIHERKEELYKNLVLSLRGFFIESTDTALKQEFVDETRLARLYASDEAIKSLNNVLDIMMKTEEAIKGETGKDYQEVAHNLFGERCSPCILCWRSFPRGFRSGNSQLVCNLL